MIDEIKKLKEIKEKSLEGILSFLSTSNSDLNPGTTVNPMVYISMYDFAEKNISNMSNKSNSIQKNYKKDYNV